MSEKPEKLKQFHLMRITAWSQGRWRECWHPRCRAAKRCKGPPRGTFSRHGYPDCYTMQEAEHFEKD